MSFQSFSRLEEFLSIAIQRRDSWSFVKFRKKVSTRASTWLFVQTIAQSIFLMCFENVVSKFSAVKEGHFSFFIDNLGEA